MYINRGVNSERCLSGLGRLERNDKELDQHSILKMGLGSILTTTTRFNE